MGDIHQLVLKHGKQAAREMVAPGQRRLVEIASEVLADEAQRVISPAPWSRHDPDGLPPMSRFAPSSEAARTIHPLRTISALRSRNAAGLTTPGITTRQAVPSVAKVRRQTTPSGRVTTQNGRMEMAGGFVIPPPPSPSLAPALPARPHHAAAVPIPA